MAEQPPCPECEKLAAVSDKSQAIGEFLEWLTGEKGLTLAQWRDGLSEDDYLTSVHASKEALLAEYFDIDMNVVETERRALLEYLQNRKD